MNEYSAISSSVSIVRDVTCAYSNRPPYHAPTTYPEYPFPSHLDETNRVYGLVRDALQRMGLDNARFGSGTWNPLGELVRPGDTVFLKPNMIAHKHALNDDWDYVITHGSVIRAVVDYVFVAMHGEGRLIIGDAPQTDSHFDLIVERMGLNALRSLYDTEKNFTIEIMDLRDEHWIEKDGIYVETIKLPGDPAGSVAVDLAGDSLFAELDGKGKTYYGAFYDTDETNQHHCDGKHEYAISRTPIEADVFINIPKLKTHKKCGITVNLKSLVGINANKNWLPHYCIGSPEDGGDQFPYQAGLKGRLENRIVLAAKKRLLGDSRTMKWGARKLKRIGYRVFGGTEEVVRSGNWHGNDTVWRMSVDLNRILMYGNPDGTMRSAGEAKRFFSIVDGIVAMEGNGPVAGTPVPAGVILAGSNPVSVDAACARLMGFDHHKLPLIFRCLEPHTYPLMDEPHTTISASSNYPAWNGPLDGWTQDTLFAFQPHFGWMNQIELST